MASITSNTVSRRRPPAIEPKRKSVRIDPPAVLATTQVAVARNELTLVVLRLPEIASAPAVIPFEAVTRPVAAPKNEQFKLIAVAGGLVLLAAALFSGGSKRPPTPVEPSHSPAVAPSANTPSKS